MESEHSLVVSSDAARMAIDLGERMNMAFVCRMCTHWWDAVCAGKLDCGIESCFGPFSGGSFREYTGPLNNLASVCFVCGAPARHGVATSNGGRVIGICNQHVSMMEQQWSLDHEYHETGKPS